VEEIPSQVELVEKRKARDLTVDELDLLADEYIASGFNKQLALQKAGFRLPASEVYKLFSGTQFTQLVLDKVGEYEIASKGTLIALTFSTVEEIGNNLDPTDPRTYAVKAQYLELALKIIESREKTTVNKENVKSLVFNVTRNGHRT
jgi:hypothetical protein